MSVRPSVQRISREKEREYILCGLEQQQQQQQQFSQRDPKPPTNKQPTTRVGRNNICKKIRGQKNATIRRGRRENFWGKKVENGGKRKRERERENIPEFWLLEGQFWRLVARGRTRRDSVSVRILGEGRERETGKLVREVNRIITKVTYLSRVLQSVPG